MAKIELNCVDDYIAAHPEPTARAVELVRSALGTGLPKAEEVISYKMPAYKLHGEIVLYFAGWKQHYSLYPVGASLLAAFKDELAAYEVDRGTIRFPLNAPVPVKLIEEIANGDRKSTRLNSSHT